MFSLGKKSCSTGEKITKNDWSVGTSFSLCCKLPEKKKLENIDFFAPFAHNFSIQILIQKRLILISFVKKKNQQMEKISVGWARRICFFLWLA